MRVSDGGNEIKRDAVLYSISTTTKQDNNSTSKKIVEYRRGIVYKIQYKRFLLFIHALNRVPKFKKEP